MFTADTLVLANQRALVAAIVDGAGTQITSFGTPVPPANAVLTQVGQSATSVSILAANLNRRQFIVVNTSPNKALSLAFAATASLTAFSVLVPAMGQFVGEVMGYTGAVSGIWTSAGGGFAVITEITQ